MNLTGKRIQREGNWGGPRIIALWFEWAKRDRKNGLRKYVQNLFNQCEEFDVSCVIQHIEYENMPFSLRNPSVNFQSYKKRWNRVIPFFIETLMNEFESPLLYMHVDTIINQLPPLEVFDKSVLVSVGKSNILKGSNNRKTHILGSPVYFSGDDISKMFIRKWVEYCDNTVDQNCGEHYLLKRTYNDLKHLDSVGIFDCKMSSRKKDNSYLFF